MDQNKAMESRSIREFGAAHGFSKPTVYRMIARGELIARKAGRRTIITGADEASWLAALPRLHSKLASEGTCNE